MARRSAKFLQEIEIVFETDDQVFREEFTVKWERTGTEPGKFLVEGNTYVFNGQEITLGSLRSPDINNLVELISGAIHGKLKREKLSFMPMIQRAILTPHNLDRVIPDLDDCARGWNRELSLNQHIIWVATNKSGRTYKADDAHGTRARLITEAAAEAMRSEYYPITSEELQEIKDQAMAIRSLLDQQMKACYSTFRSSIEELLFAEMHKLSEKHQPVVSDPDNITFSSVIERHIK